MPQPNSRRGLVEVEPSPKRVRALWVARWSPTPRPPAWFGRTRTTPAYSVPVDVRARLEPTGRTEHSPSRGDARYFDVAAGARVARARRGPTPTRRSRSSATPSGWTPWTNGSRRTSRSTSTPAAPTPGWTSWPARVTSPSRSTGRGRRLRPAPDPLRDRAAPRYYLPLTDLRTELLRPSPTVTQCPYKGTATYWSLEVDGRRTRTSPGPTAPRSPRAKRSPGWSASTTRRSTCSSTGWRSSGPAPSSPERPRRGAARAAGGSAQDEALDGRGRTPRRRSTWSPAGGPLDLG